jgi:hypothetical protein
MGLISDAIRATAAAALDSLQAPQEEGGLGKHCRLVFEPRQTKCPNCGWDTQNKTSNNKYKPGGPQPFPNGTICPVCMGKGVLVTPVTKDVVFLCNWNVKTWIALPNLDGGINLQIPFGAVQTKGFTKDVNDVLASRRMIMDTPVEGIRQYIYELHGEPIFPGNIIQGRYFFAIWKRIGG